MSVTEARRAILTRVLRCHIWAWPGDTLRAEGTWLIPLRDAVTSGTDVDADTLSNLWNAALPTCHASGSINRPSPEGIADVLELFKAFGLPFHTLVQHNESFTDGVVCTRFFGIVLIGHSDLMDAAFQCIPFTERDCAAPAWISGQTVVGYPLAIARYKGRFGDTPASRALFRRILEHCSPRQRDQVLIDEKDKAWGVLDYLLIQNSGGEIRRWMRDIIALSGCDGTDMTLRVGTLAKLTAGFTYPTPFPTNQWTVAYSLLYLDFYKALQVVATFRVYARALVRSTLYSTEVASMPLELCGLVSAYAWPCDLDAWHASHVHSEEAALKRATAALDVKCLSFKVRCEASVWRTTVKDVSMNTKVGDVLAKAVTDFALPVSMCIEYRLSIYTNNGTATAPLDPSHTLSSVCDSGTDTEFVVTRVTAPAAPNMGLVSCSLT
jgi:hypothetical protein